MTQISVATANFYFRNIELDLYWQWKMWSMAQHLKDLPVSQAIQSVHRSGLKVTSIHDGGGVLNHYNSVNDYINPCLDAYLEQLGYAPEYMVFHPPHAEGVLGPAWWRNISVDILGALEPYRKVCACLTLENMPFFDGFTVPLTTPEELLTFVTQNELRVNLDTTHYAQIGVNPADAVLVLRDKIHSVHLSDYAGGQVHVYVGEGSLDLAGFINRLDAEVLDTITIECSVSSPGRSDREMGHGEIVDRMKILKSRVEGLFNGAVNVETGRT
jgi:sugar phosphate isomerase/epimerase